MLEYFIQAPYRLRQLRQRPLSEHIEAFAEELRRLGFTRASGRRILWLTRKFNEFALSVGVEQAESINEQLVEQFLSEALMSHRTRRDARSAMTHLLENLRDRGVIPKVVKTGPVDPFESILIRYDSHLCDVRGLTLGSRSQYLRHARLLLSWLQSRHGSRPLAELKGIDVLDFVTKLAPLHPSGSWRNNLCSLTRVFLRYLRWEGIIQVDLDRIVPKLPRWRLSGLPRDLAWKKVRELIDSVDTSKHGGLRDKAVLLLIATLGLRRNEVCCLQLNHLDWRAAEILVTKTKSRRERTLPLPQEVGAALVEYLLHERPRLPVPHVFLSNRAPVEPLTPCAISGIVSRHLRRTGIQAPNHGAHLLRHSLATRLVNQRVSIKQIADLLGHASINTTAIYTKVDIATLAEVALPFPGGEP